MRVELPTSTIKNITLSLNDKLSSKFKPILNRSMPMSRKDLEKICLDNNIIIVSDKKFPRKDLKGFSINIDDTNFIIINPSYARNNFESKIIIGHELSHIILGHMDDTNFAVAGYSDISGSETDMLQEYYVTGKELEAELLSLTMILPDPVLHNFVKEEAYIKAIPIAKNNELSVNWVSARIQLYRLIYGYEKTFEKLRDKEKLDRINNPDWNRKIVSVEGTEGNPLQKILPHISETLNQRLYI